MIGASKTCRECGRTGGQGYRRDPETRGYRCSDARACRARIDLNRGQGCLMCAPGQPCEAHAAALASTVQLSIGEVIAA